MGLTRIAVLAMLVVASVAALAPAAGAEPLPEIKQPVTDITGALSQGMIERLAKELVELRAKHGVHLAVLVVDTTDSIPISDYAYAVAMRWSGSDARNQGALFVLAVQDRRMRLELGYGLETVISDAEARRMLDGLRPHLKRGDLGGAISALITKVAHAATGRTETSDADVQPLAGGSSGCDQNGFLWFFVLIVIMVVWIVGRGFAGSGDSAAWSDWSGSGQGPWSSGDSWTSGSSGSATTPWARGWDGGESSFGGDSGSSFSSSDWGGGSSSYDYDSGSSFSSGDWGGGGGDFGGGGASSSW